MFMTSAGQTRHVNVPHVIFGCPFAWPFLAPFCIRYFLTRCPATITLQNILANAVKHLRKRLQIVISHIHQCSRKRISRIGKR